MCPEIVTAGVDDGPATTVNVITLLVKLYCSLLTPETIISRVYIVPAGTAASTLMKGINKGGEISTGNDVFLIKNNVYMLLCFLHKCNKSPVFMLSIQ